MPCGRCRPSRRWPDSCAKSGRRSRTCTRRAATSRSEEHTSELQSLRHLVCRLLLEKKKRLKCRERGGDSTNLRHCLQRHRPISQQTQADKPSLGCLGQEFQQQFQATDSVEELIPCP